MPSIVKREFSMITHVGGEQNYEPKKQVSLFGFDEHFVRTPKALT
jgi:hypothetical protein